MQPGFYPIIRRVLSQRARYALKAMLALAEADDGTPMMIGTIARQQRIPQKFLALILLDLKRFGLVQSRRGREGGYLLAKPPSKISFGEVVRLIEGPLALLPCVSKTQYRRCADCVSERDCPIHTLLAEVRASTAEIMDSRSLEDVIGPRARKPENAPAPGRRSRKAG
jgi:Rrf2 family protein